VTALRPTQLEALHFLIEGGRCIYGDPPGTGKTAVGLSLAARTGDRTLIVVPANVLLHWTSEAEAFTPGYPVAMYRGSHTLKQRRVAIESWLDNGGALVTNYEAVRRDADILKHAAFAQLILDEAHRIKGRRTQTTLAVAGLARKARYLTHITGTPVMNRAEELWSMLNMIDHRAYPSYWRWAEEHFYVALRHFGTSPRPVRVVGKLRPGAEETVRAQLLGRLLIRPLAYLLPELGDEPIVSTLRIELTPAERRQYDQMAKHGWTEETFAEGIEVADLEIAKRTRLLQLGSDWGGLLPDKGLGSKAKAAVDLAEDIGRPVVILTKYRATAHRIAEAIDDSRVYTGGMRPEAREDARLDFVAGRSPALVGTIAALGTGVDGLQGTSRDMIFVDLDDVYDVNRQAIGRLYRSGQTGAVNVWVIAAADTYDQVIAKANAEQRDVKELLTGKPWQDLVKGNA